VRSFEVGVLAAKFHDAGFLHGDLHAGNLSYDKDKQRGKRAGTFDVGDSQILNRPATPRERAQDLAIWKMQVSFIAWEATKLGYRYQTPEIAPAVFVLI